MLKYLQKYLIKGPVLTDTEKLARMFKILSVETRIRMIDLLKGQPFCVNALAHFLGITPAAASQHLRVMKDAEIVVGVKRGYFMHYRINRIKLAEWNEATRGLLHPDEGPSPLPVPKRFRSPALEKGDKG